MAFIAGPFRASSASMFCLTGKSGATEQWSFQKSAQVKQPEAGTFPNWNETAHLIRTYPLFSLTTIESRPSDPDIYCPTDDRQATFQQHSDDGHMGPCHGL